MNSALEMHTLTSPAPRPVRQKEGLLQCTVIVRVDLVLSNALIV